MKSGSKHNYLYLIWKDPRSRRNYIVGKLSRGDKYTFEYCEEYNLAREVGWNFLEAFPEEKKYESQSLFAAFSARLPDPKRRGIADILKKYSLEEYDGYELLKKSTGRLPIDTYEFIDPIFPEDRTIEREFYVVGIRHSAECRGIRCEDFPSVNLGDELTLCMEPENKHDRFAVKVLTKRSEVIGYIPRYYSESITVRLNQGTTYSLEIIDIHRDKNCEDCLKVRLNIPKNKG